jgi:hypothetical protein
MCVRALLSSTENNVCFSKFVSLFFPFLIFFLISPCFDGSSGEGECQKPPRNLSERVFDLIHSTPAT